MVRGNTYQQGSRLKHNTGALSIQGVPSIHCCVNSLSITLPLLLLCLHQWASFFICSVEFPQLFELFHRYLWTVTGENYAYSCFGCTVAAFFVPYFVIHFCILTKWKVSFIGNRRSEGEVKVKKVLCFLYKTTSFIAQECTVQQKHWIDQMSITLCVCVCVCVCVCFSQRRLISSEWTDTFTKVAWTHLLSGTRTVNYLQSPPKKVDLFIF